jgi:hypothetical protein
MPEQKLGTGNKRAVLQRPGTSYTSPNAIKLQQRRAAALDYRLQGHAFWKIGKALNWIKTLIFQGESVYGPQWPGGLPCFPINANMAP